MQFSDVVHHGRATHAETELSFKLVCSLCSFREFVLDALSFVDDDAVPEMALLAGVAGSKMR
jgi:hypothetical protein